MNPLLQVEQLHVSFKNYAGIARAVQDVSFEIQAGEVLGLVGESGSGKSVTGLTLTGLIPQPNGRLNKGRVLIKGKDLYALSPREQARVRGRDIAMIFQEPMTSLNPVFRNEEQIAEAILIHEKLGKKELHERVIALLNDVRIPSAEKVARSYPHQLSGGMRQRIMIAMAMSCRPDVLIADEPTTALDVSIQAQILDLMQELVEKSSLAMLFITHDLAVISQIAHRVAVMYCGEIVEIGEAEEVLREPLHPYTQGLIKARPEHYSPEKGYQTIKGQVASLFNLPQGCYFAPRCPYAKKRCLEEHPRLLGKGRLLRCHRVEENCHE